MVNDISWSKFSHKIQGVDQMISWYCAHYCSGQLPTDFIDWLSWNILEVVLGIELQSPREGMAPLESVIWIHPVDCYMQKCNQLYSSHTAKIASYTNLYIGYSGALVLRNFAFIIMVSDDSYIIDNINFKAISICDISSNVEYANKHDMHSIVNA